MWGKAYREMVEDTKKGREQLRPGLKVNGGLKGSYMGQRLKKDNVRHLESGL